MKASPRLIRSVGYCVFLIVFAACGSDDDGPVTPGDTGDVIVTGEVTRIQNDIAVDGGITLDVDLLEDGSDRLIFVGLFTDPPPTETELRLYDVLRRVEIGDIVRAEGERRVFGIRIEKLWILDGQPFQEGALER